MTITTTFALRTGDELVWDPRTGIHVWPHHRIPGEQCAATDRGFFCTVKAGHAGGWHAAYGPRPSNGTLHIWLDEEVARHAEGAKR
jgi:hypothetical protein